MQFEFQSCFGDWSFLSGVILAQKSFCFFFTDWFSLASFLRFAFITDWIFCFVLFDLSSLRSACRRFAAHILKSWNIRWPTVLIGLNLTMIASSLFEQCCSFDFLYSVKILPEKDCLIWSRPFMLTSQAWEFFLFRGLHYLNWFSCDYQMFLQDSFEQQLSKLKLVYSFKPFFFPMTSRLTA